MDEPTVLRCNCMVNFADGPLPPFEHHETCPCHAGVIEYRTRIIGRPNEADDWWTRSYDEALDEFEAFQALGEKWVCLERRVITPAAEGKGP